MMNYENFSVAVYIIISDILYNADLVEIERQFSYLEKHVQIAKVYIETFRTGNFVDRDKIRTVKDFFKGKGVLASGGITLNPKAEKHFEYKSYCYSNKQHLEEIKKVITFSAELFDEIILDDFFFNNCKCPECVAAKGGQSWTEFRLDRARTVSRELLLEHGKKINPRLKLIIKYPNWYEDFQATGYDLEVQAADFDMIYTGTETRNPLYTQQSLQPYTAYFLMRYLENVKPGFNGGGWFDTYDCSYNPNAYLDQSYLTLFARAREVLLFCLGLLAERDRLFVPLAGFSFDRCDKFLDRLGKPLGISCYKPYHSMGEDYLHGYLGMLGLPLEPGPLYPKESDIVLLTESAKKDESILSHIKQSLLAGKTVAITSGFVKALQDKGLKDIAELEVTGRKVAVSEFGCVMHECAFKNYAYSSQPILIPEINFNTNDMRPVVVGFAEYNNYPILLEASYGAGRLLILTVPERFGDLYHYPPEVLNTLRANLCASLPVSLEGPSQIALFPYDNDSFIVKSFLPPDSLPVNPAGPSKTAVLHDSNTFIVKSFLPCRQSVSILVKNSGVFLEDLETGERIDGTAREGNTAFPLGLPAATFRVFAVRKGSSR
jgi:hypothetical protein